MLISFFLLLFDFADLDIMQVKVLGIQFLVGRPEFLIYATWTVWLYFLIRYYQYLINEGELGIVSFYSSDIHRKALEYTLENHEADTTPEGSFFMKKIEKFLKWAAFFRRYNPTSGNIDEEHCLEIPRMKTFRWKVESAFKTIFHTSLFTDYVLPICLAIAAPILTLSI